MAESLLQEQPASLLCWKLSTGSGRLAHCSRAQCRTETDRLKGGYTPAAADGLSTFRGMVSEVEAK
jgi:hypothetical protein